MIHNRKTHLKKHFSNMRKLCKNPNPSDKETREMYNYLNYCFVCGKKLSWFNAQSHGFEGQCHSFGCSLTAKGFGYFCRALQIIIFLPICIIIGIPLIVIEKIRGKKK